VTSGHGDFRTPADLPRTAGGPLSHQEAIGASAVADSPDEVRMRVREQLFQGASQIKITAGGGVASPNSPLDVLTFTAPEVRAAVEAARNWGTYVAAHAYTPEVISQAIRAGVLCIEHAHLMDDATAKEMADKGIWLSTQPIPAEMIGAFPPGSDEAAKAKEIVDSVDHVFNLARKYHLKTAFGTDIIFSPQLTQHQGALLAGLGKWFSPAEVLTMATGTNAQLLSLSGKRSPYDGKLGVVEEGALADLLLVDGDPTENLALVADPETNFVLIMKDGKVYKNSLAQR
jgi:imidazolonepropionase-like amidohydrolase